MHVCIDARKCARVCCCRSCTYLAAATTLLCLLGRKLEQMQLGLDKLLGRLRRRRRRRRRIVHVIQRRRRLIVIVKHVNARTPLLRAACCCCCGFVEPHAYVLIDGKPITQRVALVRGQLPLAEIARVRRRLHRRL